MVVCKYYLQGNCRFGENCKFQHQQTNNELRDTSSSVLRPQHFNMNPTNVDTNTLIRSLTNDMLAAEKGGQWLLSCYAPFKDRPAFPGFEDQSFEEVRLGFYEAQHNGTVEQYKQQLQRALQEAAMMIKALQNPSAEAVNCLKQIYNSPPVSSLRNSTSPGTGFGSPSNFGAAQNQASIFGGQNAQTKSSVFGQTPQSVFGATNQGLFSSQNVNQPAVNQQSMFGGKSPLLASQNPSFTTPTGNNSSVFGNQPQNNVFGGQQPSVFTQQSVFNQQQINNPFGNAQSNSSSSVFGASPFTSTVQNTMFGGPQQQATPNVFGQTLQQATTTNAFGQQNASGFPGQNVSGFPGQNASVFSTPQQSGSFFEQHQNNAGQQMFAQPSLPQQNAAPMFGQPVQQQQSASIFSQPNTSQQSNVSVFGQQQSLQNSVFAQQQQQPSLYSTNNTHSSSIFGSTQNTLVQNVNQNDDIYSKLEELSESDIKWFQGDSFEFGTIPELPPTLDMCRS